MCAHVWSQQSTRVVGYLPTWSNFASKADNTDFNKLSHINISFANPNAAGDLDEGLSDAILNDFITKAHLNGTEVLISVGGATAPSEIWEHLLKEENRTAFIDKIVDYLTLYDYDGIDIDLEGGDITADYGEFITELSVKLQNDGLLLTAALAQWNGNKITDQALFAFDFINLMAYDETGSWSSAGPHSSMSFAQKNLDYWAVTRNYPSEDCVLGVPFYGYDFSKSGASITYKSIIETYPNAENLDQINQIYYNGKPTIGAKTVLAVENYGGIMIWELNQDITGQHSLLDTIYTTIDDKNYTIGTANRRPIVSIIDPINNKIILEDSTMTITANVFDKDGTIEYVAFILNGDTINRFSNGGPYTINREHMVLGDYEISVFAIDDKGAEKESTKIHFSVEKPKPIVSFSSPSPMLATLINNEIEITFTVTDTIGEVNFVALLADKDTLIKYSSAGTYTFKYTPSTYGFLSLSCYAKNDLGGEVTSNKVPVVINEPRAPYNGTAFLIPGTIEAEEYDLGGYNSTYYDNEIENLGGSSFRNDAMDIETFNQNKYNLGYLKKDEWVEYSIEVTESTDFDIYIVHASQISGGQFSLYLDDELLITSPSLSSTGGWSTFKETKIATKKTLEIGSYILRLKITATEFNIDKLIIKEHTPLIASVNSENNEQLATIYPNPVNSIVTINMNNNSEGSFTLSNSQGQIVHYRTLINSVEQVDLSSLASGVYFGSISQDNKTQVVKIIKN